MKKLFLPALFLLALPVFTSCDGEDEKGPEYEAPYDYYILNEGSWGKNNGSISAYGTQGMVSDIYSAANGKDLGDVAQDLVYDSKNHCLYVSVSESQYIAKLDVKGKELARYSTTSEQGQPRSLVLNGGYLYASLYGGMVAKLNTTNLSLVGTAKVGTYSEQMAVIDNYLAVCNSGFGAENTLSIIDLKSFSVVKTIELPHMNPQHIVACNGAFYCNTTEYDEYWNAVSTIVEVNPKNWAVKDIATGFYMAPASTDLYILEQDLNYYTSPYSYNNTFKTYSTSTATLKNGFLPGGLEKIFADQAIYSFSVDPDTNDIYLFQNNQEGAEYVNSRVFVYDNNGKEISNEMAGILAKKVVFAK